MVLSDSAVLPRKNRFKRVQVQSTRPFRNLFLGLLLGGVIAATLSVVYLLSYSNPFPLREVQLLGPYQYVNKDEINKILSSDLDEGFFGTSVDNLRSGLLTIPWVREAWVRRIWPDTLEISIVEHEPFALWNDTAIITKNGALITPKDVSLNQELPRLAGVDGRHNWILNNWYKLGKTLARIDLTISRIELADRGAWQLTLSNGIQLELGTSDIESRLERFMRVYDKILSNRVESIAYVDLRYTRGLAIGWKE